MCLCVRWPTPANACARTCTHTCTASRAHAPARTRKRAHTRAHKRTHTRAHTHTHARAHARTHTRTHARTLTRAQLHMRSHTLTHIRWNARIRTYTYAHPQPTHTLRRIIISIHPIYTGSLGLNLLDPVSCRGLFALFALSFDIVSPEASRHRRLTFRFAPGRHARIQQTFIVICGVDRWTDGRTTRRTTDPPGCARRPCVCVRTGPPRRRRAHNQSTSDLTVTLHFGQDPFRPENTRQFCVLSLMQSCSLQKGTRDYPKPCCKMLI